MLFGYGSTSSAAETQQNTSTEEDNQDDSEASESTAQDDQEAAEQLLTDLKGTYQELWPVILADEYNQLWLDDSAAIVGDDNAEAAVEKMSSMVTGTVTGEEAVETYKDGNMAYDCRFFTGCRSVYVLMEQPSLARIKTVKNCFKHYLSL